MWRSGAEATCHWVPVAIGTWTLVEKANGQHRWFCPFCGQPFKHGRVSEMVTAAEKQGYEIPQDLRKKEYPLLGVYRLGEGADLANVEVCLAERAKTELQRGLDVLKLLTQTNLRKVCTRARGDVDDHLLFKAITLAIQRSDKRFGVLVSAFKNEQRPLVLPEHKFGNARILWLGKKRSLSERELGVNESRQAFQVDPFRLMQGGFLMGDPEHTAILASLRTVVNTETFKAELTKLANQNTLAANPKQGSDAAPPRIRKGVNEVIKLIEQPWDGSWGEHPVLRQTTTEA